MSRTVLKKFICYGASRQYLLNSPRHPVNMYRKQLKKDGIDFTERVGLAESFDGVVEMKGRIWHYATQESVYRQLFTEKETVVVFDF